MWTRPLGPSVELPKGHETCEGCAEWVAGTRGHGHWGLRWSSRRATKRCPGWPGRMWTRPLGPSVDTARDTGRALSGRLVRQHIRLPPASSAARRARWLGRRGFGAARARGWGLWAPGDLAGLLGILFTPFCGGSPAAQRPFWTLLRPSWAVLEARSAILASKTRLRCFCPGRGCGGRTAVVFWQRGGG